MAEIVDWQHLDEHHKYQQINNEDHCWICGKTMKNHWFPITDSKKLADLHQQVYDIADEAWNNT